jgi:hypothetical protein
MADLFGTVSAATCAADVQPFNLPSADVVGIPGFVVLFNASPGPVGRVAAEWFNPPCSCADPPARNRRLPGGVSAI